MHDAFARDLAKVINRHSVENVSDTPDVILGKFLVECLDAFDVAVNARTEAARPAEQPQDERDGDVRAVRALKELRAELDQARAELDAILRAVDSLLQADDEDVPRALEYLRAFTADRIEALIERDANGGAK